MAKEACGKEEIMVGVATGEASAMETRLAGLRARFPVEPMVDRALSQKMLRRGSPIYLPPPHDIVAARLSAFLAHQMDTPVAVHNLRALTGGASKEQFLFELDWVKDGVPRKRDKMVLRCDPGASIVETSRIREFELMQFAAGLIPVPPVYWIDADGTHMGTPSMVAGFIEGVQKPALVSSNVTGMGIHFPDVYRRDLCPQYVEYMVALHKAEIPVGALPAFQRPKVGTREASDLIVNWWARVWAEDLYEQVPIATLTELWLRRNAPVLDHLSVVHGDFRTGNFLFDEESRRITGILDWELGYLGDRHGDIGWVLTDIYVTREDGRPFHCGLFPSEDALVEAYEAAGGLPINRRTLHWHKVFCTWKELVLSLGSALRAGDGQSHQDVLLSWLAGCGYMLCEALRRMLETEA